jgi:pimeloyl-ACP methyl ester carboxylesterase
LKALGFISGGRVPPLWREARFGLETAALLRDPILRGEGMPNGGGRPVLVIPGFMAGDGSLGMMAGWLKRAGYRPSRAGMRINVDCSGVIATRLERRLGELVAAQGRRAVIVGQSRGGTIARVLGARRPELVCGVVALGSPQLDPLAIHPLVRLQVEAVARLGSLGLPGLFKRSCLEDDCCASFWASLAEPLPSRVGLVSVYSKTDGIVDWRSCLDPHGEQVEIDTSHCGMAVSPAAWRAVAGALAGFERAEGGRRSPQAGPYPRAA